MEYKFALKQSKYTANVATNVNCSLHLHRQLEIVLVTENQLTMQVNLETYDIKKGTAIIVRPYEPHSFITKEPNKCLIIEFSPDFYKPFYDWLNEHTSVGRKISIPEQTFNYLLTVLPKRSTAQTDIQAYGLLAPLCRAIIENGEWKNESSRLDDVFLSALNIISREYSGALSREYVAKRLGVCPQTLSRIFKKNSKIDFVNYVQYIRIFHTIRLFEENESITDAAYQSGFDSIRTFNRVFKKIIGMAPSEYIKSGMNTSMEFYASVND